MTRADGASDADHGAARDRILARLGIKAVQPSIRPAAQSFEPPYALSYLWVWFNEVLAGVTPNGMGPLAIGWRDLGDWMNVTGRRLHHWECLLMLRLSHSRAKVVSEKPDKPVKPGS